MTQWTEFRAYEWAHERAYVGPYRADPDGNDVLAFSQEFELEAASDEAKAGFCSGFEDGAVERGQRTVSIVAE